MLYITEQAQSKIQTLLKKHNMQFFRIIVDTGGCKGFVYNFSYDNNQNHDDTLYNNILIDKISKPFLNEATIDFTSNVMKSEFKINNPNFKKSCGCNKSFS